VGERQAGPLAAVWEQRSKRATIFEGAVWRVSGDVADELRSRIQLFSMCLY